MGFKEQPSKILITCFCSEVDDKVYGWLDCVILILYQFIFVNDSKNQQYSFLPMMDRKSFMKYMKLSVEKVEKKIKLDLPNKLQYVLMVGMQTDITTSPRLQFGDQSKAPKEHFSVSVC